MEIKLPNGKNTQKEYQHGCAASLDEKVVPKFQIC